MSRAVRLLRPLIPPPLRPRRAVVPVVRLTGIIGYPTPLRPGLSLSTCAHALDRAFSFKDAKAVALAINSPGGSAVQSHLIFRRIRELRNAKRLPVVAYVEDVAASGGYMIACAADEIVVDETSIVGSIGVVGGSFGFHGLLEKLGIERRLYTSGENKAMLDPFLPERPDDVARLKTIQREIHERFIALVKECRGGKLREDEANLFTGEYWTGERGVALGLADRIGDLRGDLRARFGDKVETPLVSQPRSWFGRPTPGITGAEAVFPWNGRSFAHDALSTLEARALWGRYGL